MEAARKALLRRKQQETGKGTKKQKTEHSAPNRRQRIEDMDKAARRMRAIREAKWRLCCKQLPSIGDRRADVEPPHCKAQLDRVTVGCKSVYMDGLLESTGYERVRAFRLPKLKGVFLPYSRVNYLENPENGARMRVYSGPNGAKLAPYRVEFFPPDDLGFDQATARAVFQHFEEPRISLVEMALDFPVGSDVDSAYVRARAVFGKCHPYSVGHRPGWDALGHQKRG
jgi:hypothetical protein